MKFEEALAALKKLDGGADLASAIETHVNSQAEKIFTTIGESRTKGAKASNLEATLLAIAKTLGIEGDVDTVLTGLEPKVTAIASDLKTAQTKLAETETRATTAETKVQGFERKGKLADIATKAGASAAVLETLFGDKIDQLAIDGETVKFGDKALREHVESDVTLKEFVTSLFPPTEQPQSKPAPKLPSGSPKGEAPAQTRSLRISDATAVGRL
jgi:hypothetical protein